MLSPFLDLPLEIRLQIYSLVFGNSTVILRAKRRGDDNYSLLPSETATLHDTHRSSQLLRVCKTVHSEAAPLLYSNTEFHVIAQAFAGRLPCTVTNGHPAISCIQNLTWQLECDLLKRFNQEDMRLNASNLTQIKRLELRCRAETWRNPFLGEWCDREDFVRGRDQTISWAKTLQSAMAAGKDDSVILVEDRSQLDRGRVVLKLTRGMQHVLLNNEVLLT